MKSCKEAILTIYSNTTGVPYPYAFVIGARNNSATILYLRNSVLAESSSPGILNCTRHKTMWVKWSSNELQIGSGLVLGEKRILYFLNKIPINPLYISLGSGNETEEVSWILDHVEGTKYLSSLHITQYKAMAVGTGGGGQLPPPPIFCQPKKFKIIKTRTYRSVYRNMDKICL